MRALAILAIAALTLSSRPALRAAQAQGAKAFAAGDTDISAAKRRKKQVRSAAAPVSSFEAVRSQAFGAERAQIACPRSGCQAVPRGCLREPERSFDGTATGFDSIVCPPR